MKIFFRYVGYILLSIITFVLCYLLGAYCLSRITVNKEAGSASDVTIYIKTNGVHTDIVVPVKSDQIDWSKEIKFSNTKLNDSTMKFLAMGWGDKGFYLETPSWSDLTCRVAFKAAFGLGNTAIHATFYSAMIEDSACKRIEISKAQYERLIIYISESFKKDSSARFINIITTANYSVKDAFYEANGSYSMFHTCNTWANTGLKRCGQKACLWTPFDTGIFLKYK